MQVYRDEVAYGSEEFMQCAYKLHRHVEKSHDVHITNKLGNCLAAVTVLGMSTSRHLLTKYAIFDPLYHLHTCAYYNSKHIVHFRIVRRIVLYG